MVVLFLGAATILIGLVLIFILRPVFDRKLSDQKGVQAGGLLREKQTRMVLVAGAGLLPIILAGIYLQVGSVNLIGNTLTQVESDPPLGPGERDPEAQAELIEGMVAGLAARLEQNPNDLEGWRMLARSQIVLERLDKAENSYRRLLAINDQEFQDWRALADVQVALSEETFPTHAEFLETLTQIDQRWSNHPYVLYYRGGAKRARLDYEGALADWRALLVSIPETQPARVSLLELIRETEIQQKSAKSVPE